VTDDALAVALILVVNNTICFGLGVLLAHFIL
jgi:hypothetical protein